ncbi:hypothetical protein WR25_24985 [Diploscapter pachys]|uniref:Uncharacterized protein n=1 Tax=Diploscapter pachys TaxID=2018661 RepID=A0A2A2M4Q7_9BILA|nr:hypothetical protein WR25_24985 [Diploscapter pachys]
MDLGKKPCPQGLMSSSSPMKRAAPASRRRRSTSPSRSPRRAPRSPVSTSITGSAPSAATSTIAPRRCSARAARCPCPSTTRTTARTRTSSRKSGIACPKAPTS